MHKSIENGKEIAEHLSRVNMSAWDYIYQNYVKNDTVEELNKNKKSDPSD